MASDAARAVNVFMGFSSRDQDTLLEVLQDYFSSSDGPERDDPDNDDVDDDDGAQESLQGNCK